MIMFPKQRGLFILLVHGTFAAIYDDPSLGCKAAKALLGYPFNDPYDQCCDSRSKHISTPYLSGFPSCDDYAKMDETKRCNNDGENFIYREGFIHIVKHGQCDLEKGEADVTLRTCAAISQNIEEYTDKSWSEHIFRRKTALSNDFYREFGIFPDLTNSTKRGLGFPRISEDKFAWTMSKDHYHKPVFENGSSCWFQKFASVSARIKDHASESEVSG